MQRAGVRPLISSVVLAVALVHCGGDEAAGPGALPESVAVDPEIVDLRIGEARQLEPRYLGGGGQAVVAPAEWTPAWSSSDTSIVALDEDGWARGRRVGTVTLTVSSGPLSGAALARVLQPSTQFEDGAAAQATIGAEGGSIQASVPGEPSYLLVVPQGALVEPVEITLTPLSGIDNLPLSGGLAAAVEFGPDGLTFLRPAELKIVTDGTVEGAGLVGFGIEGSDFRLAPVSMRGDTLMLMVGHFSGAGVAEGEPDEVAALAALPAANAEQAALQEIAAHTAAAAAAGRDPDPAAMARSLAEWYEASVRPDLEAAASDSTRLASAMGELTRWESQVGLWADGLLEEEIAAGRALLAAAIESQIDRLNAWCSAQNDSSPIAEIIRWTGLAELLGLTAEHASLQVDAVVENLCLQVVILEATLPETLTGSVSVTLDVKAGTSIGGRPPVFHPSLDITVDGGSTASGWPPSGQTMSDGSFTTEVSLGEGSQRARVSVQASYPELPAIADSRTLTAEGTVSLDLGISTGGHGALASDVEIDPGSTAQVVVTLLKGRGGYVGPFVSLELAGGGTLNKNSAAVDSETGTASVWYTAPATGEGEAVIVARHLEDGTLYADSVRVRYTQFEPVDLELGFDGEQDPAVEGPVLSPGADYLITVTGTYSIWTSEWEDGVCKGEPNAGADGPAGIDAEHHFAIPVGSTLCGEQFECCPNHNSKFRMSLAEEGFDHIEPIDGKTYHTSHVYEYRVTGEGHPISFSLDVSAPSDDDYGLLQIHIERAPLEDAAVGPDAALGP